ncbi:MAG: hypothetical protein RL754_273 [Bacteroidota bacterium]
MNKTLVFTAMLAGSALLAQNMKKEKFTFEYTQPPLIHLDEGIGYDFKVVLDYKKEIEAELAEAERVYQEELAAYPAKEAAAKAAHDELVANYEKALEEWNSKSAVGKIIEKQVLENQKPQPPSPYYPPSRPYKRTVIHEKIFDEAVLESTYGKIEGLSQDPNGISIEVHLFGFENEDPIAEKKEYKEYNSKTKQSSTYFKSWWSIRYRHNMSLNVTMPDGSILFSEVPQSISDFATFTSPEEKRSSPSTSAATHLENLQNTAVTENMDRIRWVLNDKLGTTTQAWNAEINYVKDNKGNYEDLENAMFDAKEGFSMLMSRNDAAKEKLVSAINTWDAAISEIDVDDKKARINKKVAPDLFKNIILACAMIQNFDKADDYYSQSLRLGFGNRDESDLKELKLLTDNLRERYQQ